MLLINFLTLPALIVGFAAVAPIDTDIKIGFRIVALAASSGNHPFGQG
jgi:bile acid:Na+ symporter, BASS family